MIPQVSLMAQQRYQSMVKPTPCVESLPDNGNQAASHLWIPTVVQVDEKDFV
jgi:hypothetical protein